MNDKPRVLEEFEDMIVNVYEPDGTLNSFWTSVEAARAFIAKKPGWTYEVVEP